MLKIRDWNGKRVVFLGDGITASAAYSNFLEAYIVRNFLTECNVEFINVALSAETVSGLSEEKHPFVRPCLLNRIDGILSELKPDFVFFMYGMNEGIFSKFNEERFELFKSGVLKCIEKINGSGAEMVILTPTPFDSRSFMGELSYENEPAEGYLSPYINYNETLREYSKWLVTLSDKVYKVIDIFSMTEEFINSCYDRNPQYSSGDGIHPNYTIHWGIACQILKQIFNITVTKTPSYVDNPSTNEIFLILWKNNKMVSDAWKEHIGHENAVKAKTVSVEEAMDSYAQTKETIGELIQAAPKPLEVSNFKGYKRYDFNINGRECIIIEPKTPKGDGEWIWRTEFFGAFDMADMALLERGYYIGYCRLSDMYGSPYSVKKMEKFRQFVCFKFKLNQRPFLFGFSRGGLYAVNYALKHHYNVSGLYLDAPVLDLKSWPKGKHEGCYRQLLEVYNMTEEELLEYKDNPIDNTEVLAKFGIPVILVAGGADTVVPFSENGEEFARRFRENGGEIEVIVKPDCEHHPHSLEDPSRIVDFVEQHS